MTTFSQLYVHLAFCTKNNRSTIGNDWKELLSDFLSLRLKRRKCVPLGIEVLNDHVHLLVKFNEEITLQDLINELKSSSVRFINNYKLTEENFEWSDDEICVCLCYSQVEVMQRYLRKQHDYHYIKLKSWRDELDDLMDLCEEPLSLQPQIVGLNTDFSR